MENLQKNPIFAKLQSKISSNDENGAVKLFKKGLLGNNSLFAKIDKSKLVTNRLAGGPAAEPEDNSNILKPGKDDNQKAISNLFFENLKMIKNKLEKKKRDQKCRYTQDQIKALKEYREQ